MTPSDRAAFIKRWRRGTVQSPRHQPEFKGALRPSSKSVLITSVGLRDKGKALEAKRDARWGKHYSIELVLKQGFDLQATSNQYYCLVSDGTKVMSSRLSVADGTGNPCWNEYFMFSLEPDSQVLVISVWQKQKGRESQDEFVGATELPLTNLPSKFHRRCPGLLSKDMTEPVTGAILFKVGFTEDKCDYFPCQRNLNDRGGAVLTNAIRGKVSKKKNRFQEQGFDLDLTYITKRIVAMGFPSSGFESTYRNRMPEVQRFFNTRHLQHYHIFNLCSERQYEKACFNGAVSEFGFDDHNPCPLAMLKDICEGIHKYLCAHPQNVSAIHCKAGKGRTGLAICSYLVYSGQSETAASALAVFGNKRTSDGKGVTIPSQKRYVGYVEQCVRLYMEISKKSEPKNKLNKNNFPENSTRICKAMSTPPISTDANLLIDPNNTELRTFQRKRSGSKAHARALSGVLTRSSVQMSASEYVAGWSMFPPRVAHIHKVCISELEISGEVFLEVQCSTFGLLYNSEKVGDSCTKIRNERMYREWNPKPIHVSEDVKVILYTRTKLGRRGKLFHFWFNTRMHQSSTLLISKPNLDEACKSKKYSENLSVRLIFRSDGKSDRRTLLFRQPEGLLKKPDDEKWKEIDLTEEIKSCEKVMAQLKQYGHEKLVWAGQVMKWSTGRRVYQNRVLVLSSSAFYNFKPEKVKKGGKPVYTFAWRYKYESLKWITCTTASNEFILHLPSQDFDYRFSCHHNKYICQMMSSFLGVTNGCDAWSYVDMVDVTTLDFIHRKGRKGHVRLRSIDRKMAIRNVTPLSSRSAAPFAPISASAFIRRWVAVACYEAFNGRKVACKNPSVSRSSLPSLLGSQGAHARINLIVDLIGSYVSPLLSSVERFRMQDSEGTAKVVVLGGDRNIAFKIPSQLEVTTAGTKFQIQTEQFIIVDRKATEAAAEAEIVIFAYSCEDPESLDATIRTRDQVVGTRAEKYMLDKKAENIASVEILAEDFPHMIANFAEAPKPPFDSAREKRRRSISLRAEKICESWGSSHAATSPTTKQGWENMLLPVLQILGLEYAKVHEGMVHIKHNSWKAKIPTGAYFYRFAKVLEDQENELRFYEHSQAAPWDDPKLCIRVGRAKWIETKPPQVTLVVPKYTGTTAEERYILSFDSLVQREQMRSLVMRFARNSSDWFSMGKSYGVGNSSKSPS